MRIGTYAYLDMKSKYELIRKSKLFIIEWFNAGITATEVCRRLGGLKLSTLKRNCKLLSIEWKTQPGKNSSGPKNRIGSLEEALERNNLTVIKKFLIIKRYHRCEVCKNTDWMGNKIPLSIHHVDGNRLNNSEDNLQLLCSNCHSLTDNFGSKNRDPEKEKARLFDCLKNLRRRRLVETYGKEKLMIGEQSLLPMSEINLRKNIIYSLNVNEYGWVTKAAEQLNITHTQVRRFIKKYMPDLKVKTRKSEYERL